jgi:hypothetical protein
MMRFSTQCTRAGRTSRPQSFGTVRLRELFRRWRKHSTNSRDGWLRKDLKETCCILPCMRSRSSRMTVTLALLICLVCPLLETFDSWDNTIQTGNDTEYALVVLALCVGVAYSLARFIFRHSVLKLLARNVFASPVQKPFLSTPRSFTLLLFSAIGPPPLALRI